MTAPTAATVAAFLGQGDDPKIVALAAEHLPIVTAMVRAYVRGKGFDAFGDPDESLAAVIVSSTARLVTNPAGTIQETAGPYSVTHGTFQGWTLPELAILHTYRKRAA